MEFIKKYFMSICIGILFAVCAVVLILVLLYCIDNGWAYYYFDVIAKCSPAAAGVAAYYIWSKNREREIKELEYKNDYYKKIIDKRIEACEKVSILLRRFNKIVETNFDSKNVEYFPWITSSKGIEDVCFEIKEAMDQEIWINVDLQDELVAFYNTIEPVIINLKNKGDKEKKESINKEANDWRKKAANITLKLNEELFHLYDVEQFFITNRNQISKRAIDI